MDSALLASLKVSETYEKDAVVWFFSSKDAYYELSNMAMGFPIKYKGRTWHSSEQLYQASKYSADAECVPETKKDATDVEVKVRERIFLSKTAMASKMTQKCAVQAGLVRKDWENDVSYENMLFVLCLKFNQNPILLDILKKTNNKPLVEVSRKDSFWGGLLRHNNQKGTLIVGKNALGKMLMYIREQEKCIRKGDFIEPKLFFI